MFQNLTCSGLEGLDFLTWMGDICWRYLCISTYQVTCPHELQTGNVANQREHLILLLANAQSRVGVLVDNEIKVFCDAQAEMII